MVGAVFDALPAMSAGYRNFFLMIPLQRRYFAALHALAAVYAEFPLEPYPAAGRDYESAFQAGRGALRFFALGAHPQ